MKRAPCPFKPGDVAECGVPYLSRIRQGSQYKVLATKPRRNGGWAIQLDKEFTPWYAARLFNNLSRELPLLA